MTQPPVSTHLAEREHRMRKRLKLAPTFTSTLGRADLSVAALAREAQIDASTIHHLLNPAVHPERKGGMFPKTAWRIAKAFARLTESDETDAYNQLIVEVVE